MTPLPDELAGRLRKYRRKERTRVVAIRLDLDTPGFTYEKWGGTQRCKPGDWILHRDDETYTVDAEVFERTYRRVSPGVWEKVAPVWAVKATEPGTIPTKEGSTDYEAGDYLVFNDPEARDGWAVAGDRFHSLYDRDD